jgi:hypothetical protein
MMHYKFNINYVHTHVCSFQDMNFLFSILQLSYDFPHILCFSIKILDPYVECQSFW